MSLLAIIDGRGVRPVFIGAGAAVAGALVAQARASQLAAAASAAAAALSEGAAESLVGTTYVSTAAGIADTVDGEFFAVDNGDGTVTIYLNDSETAVAQRTLATSAALAASSGSALVGFLQSGTGAGARTAQAKLRDIYHAKDFGVVGDGTTDDTAAWLVALGAVPEGATILFNGFSLLSGTLVWPKPVNITGGTREDNGFLVSASGAYLETPDGVGCALWLPHTTTVVPSNPTGIDARRSVLKGFTVKPATTAPAATRGIVMTVVAHIEDVSVDNMASDGWAIIASNDPSSEPIPDLPLGNANGFTLWNCRASTNTGKGLYIGGNNANAGDYGNFVAFSNGGFGIDDQSFLGNNGSPELDNNTGFGFNGTDLTSSKVTLVGPYSETTPHFDLGAGALVFNPKNWKPNRAAGGVIFATVPEGAYITRDLLFASTDDIANSKGASPNTGAFMGVGDGGLDFKSSAASNRIQFNGLLSSNYAATFFNNGAEVFSFPNTAFAGNIAPGRPQFHNGFTLGGSGKSGIVASASSAPASGAYSQGAIVLNDGFSVDGNSMLLLGWAYNAAGDPVPLYVSTVSPAT